MKIMYKFADGTKSEVEVNEEIGTIILDSRREESNRDKMEQRHCYSYDANLFEGEEYGANDYYASLDESIEANGHIKDVFNQLTETQQRRVSMLAKGMSMREISRKENVNIRAVSESIECARKSFLKKF